MTMMTKNRRQTNNGCIGSFLHYAKGADKLVNEINFKKSGSQQTPVVPYFWELISLHIRSMWETICDAWACWSGWKFGPNSTEYPYSEIQFQNTPPGNENCQRSWHFDFSVSEYPPPKMKIVRDLGTLTFQFQNTPPPPKIEIWADLGTLTFQFQNTPPPENWNLGRSWHLKTFQFQNTTPPQKKLKFGQILAL